MKRNKFILVFIFLIFVVIAVGASFFILTSTISKPISLAIYVPQDREDQSKNYKTAPSKLTLILVNDSTIYAYNGNDPASVKKFNYKTVRQEIISNKHLTIVIKATKKSTYKKTVDILDEMTINGVKKYVLQDASEEEQKITEQLTNAIECFS